MRVPHLRTAAILLVAGIGLGGCATYSPYGYGGGVSVGYGNSGYYDPYYGGYSDYGYGYGSPYGYGYGSPYGYRSGHGYSPYWGWNNGYYYPGSGYYVYDNYRRPRVWTEAERRYWAERANRPGTTATRRLLDNWSDFSRGGQAASQARQTTRAISNGGRTIQVRRGSDTDTDTSAIRTRSERASTRGERASVRAERASSRSNRRTQAD